MSKTYKHFEGVEEPISTITLHRDASGWQAQFEGPDRDHMLAAFGTDTIPTAFTAEASPTEVLFRIAELNPNHHVQLAVVV